PHSFDELTNLNLSLEGFIRMGEYVSRMAEVCDNRLISLITSGYNLSILPYTWLALISGLINETVDFSNINPEFHIKIQDPVYEDTKKVVEQVKSTHKNIWNCLR
ncbi:MAG: hypothetical protein GX631_08250, partial [Dehalococcoidales bacterium]|nr:hypothetical protein [Dehalococcoidales bacterium]